MKRENRIIKNFTGLDVTEINKHLISYARETQLKFEIGQHFTFLYIPLKYVTISTVIFCLTFLFYANLNSVY